MAHTMPEEKNMNLIPQNCILEDRKKLSVSGVNDVESFDEETIIASTRLGELTIRGEKLHITHLSLEVGEMSLEGNIASITYADVVPKNTSFLSRVFR